MKPSNFMVKLRRSDGMSLTAVYDESWNDVGIFATTMGRQKHVFSFLNEEMVNKMNSIMDQSYDRVDVDYLPTSWFKIKDNEEEANLFLYTFFQRMGRNPTPGEVYTGKYISNISVWDVEQLMT